MMRLQGKVAIITGGARGIGRATAELFAREGARVHVTDLNPPNPAFQEAAIHFSVMDVSSESDWRQIVREVTANGQGVDILVNNAGIGGSYQSVAEENRADWQRVLDVNLTGVFLGMREVLPSMRARKAGSIINFSSIWGNAAVPGVAAYHATKAAVRHLTKHAAVTYAADNVRVNSIHPGITSTPVIATQAEEVTAKVIAATPLGRMALPVEIAHGVLFLASDESSFMTGAELVIDGGYLAQ
jgi:NAD(P)-dependent dehydrogenase (short-subunit alcohol dehydrogenase family)